MVLLFQLVTADEIMANDTTVTSSTLCYGCLAKTDESNTLEVYHLQTTSLQTILQTKQLILCYICMKLAKNTERFIHNVETAQDLFKYVTKVTNGNMRLVMKPLILTASLLDPDSVIRVEGFDGDEKIKIEMEYNNGYPGTEEMDTEFIKQETDKIDEMLPLDDNIESFINGLENELNVKDEDDICLLKLSKLKGTREKCKRKSTIERKKIRAEMIKSENDFIEKDARIEIIYLTNNQCLEERAKRRLDKVYLGCEFKCVDCIKGFSYRPSFDKHMERHSKIGDYKCEFCNQRYVSEEKLNVHIRIHKVRYKCTVCNYTRNCRESIIDHFAKSHGGGLVYYGCPKCEKTFKGKALLRKHMYRSHNDNFPCTICKYCNNNKQYASQESLKAHLRRKHPTEILSKKPAKKYVCRECGMRFESPSQLRNHSTKHSNAREFYCVECDKSFKTNNSLQQHLKTVSVHITSEKHPCPVCEKRFATKAHAERHIKEVHVKKNARFYCDQCGKVYRCKYKLAGHLRQHDGYEKPRSFVCNVCNKGFQLKAVLDTHVRVHTGEKPFHCSECSAQFNQYGSLYNHRKLVHKIIGKSKKEASSQEETPIPKKTKLDSELIV